MIFTVDGGAIRYTKVEFPPNSQPPSEPAPTSAVVRKHEGWMDGKWSRKQISVGFQFPS
jgi:hypothetical protein